MSEAKDGEGFLRKMARLVSHAGSEWSDSGARIDDPESDLAKAQLREMVERKRRNDFVRKRELDMLRRIRREGLSPEQLAALGSASSRLDDLGRNSELNSRIDPGVKAKIDEIEQQMVGSAFAPTQQQPLPPGRHYETTTRPAPPFAATQPAAAESTVRSSELPPLAFVADDALAGRKPVSSPVLGPASRGASPSPVPPSPGVTGASSPAASASVSPGLAAVPAAGAATLPGVSSPSPKSERAEPSVASGSRGNDLEVNELVLDPELDEAVMAFANADHEHCEQVLRQLVGDGGARQQHMETWLVLFDFFRATGRQGPFDSLGADFAQRFGQSAPQWFSLPQMVTQTLQAARPALAPPSSTGWQAPEYLDADAVKVLRGRCRSMPLPWVIDWGPLRQVEAEAASKLRDLFREWAPQPLEIRWLHGDEFLQRLAQLTPQSVRDVDPALWMLRLEALRLANRPDQYDEAAIDYCVTYEVSPPAWESAPCRVRISADVLSTGPLLTTVVGDESTSVFVESILGERGTQPPLVLELTGQLSGDIATTLERMSAELGTASQVLIGCRQLMRLDFMAAGDLLNWVVARESEGRSVIFVDAHRLVALFFGAMGINEHARIKVLAH